MLTHHELNNTNLFIYEKHMLLVAQETSTPQ